MNGIGVDELRRLIIEGGSDGTDIGNINDNLKVVSKFSNVPAGQVAYFSVDALNGSSNDMTVNGSTTAVEFAVGPGAGEVWYIFEYGIEIDDSGNANPDSFGAIANGLTNGLLITQKINSVEYDFKNLKTNADIVNSFGDHSFRGQANAYLNSNNFYSGSLELREAVKLIGDNGDKIIVRVRDNLTGLDILVFNIEGFKEV